ncbi:hypothetical protein BBP40_004777 [Aspergillus hancockii]|nr:hypothetical protein BBP40_004777 [Aspergillus hancockii]
MAEISTSEVQISDLPTKPVTFTPQRATVVREIHASIQTQDSICIEGIGPATTTTDIQTETINRREQFDDVYPPGSDEEEDEKVVDQSHDSELGHDDPELQSVREELAELEARLARA